ncbi:MULTISPECIES: hypothetical protein [Enterococcaceae]|uniref:hypothetical protein n=1 Tax=Enterococcaceae TaxID=81852 RepID=UPI000E51100E|nr:MULTISPECIES: hypothetical protein [Enterococcaceae]MCI0130098.1 hypothetical protein [Vagococcus sp. CY53-2]RGI30957.1 hypothetical protein DXC12_05000 [Melissococcus sp. OM08-11BH]UNM88918.1 hypothetical protein MN187_06375 [Vagococcus sp. CY52-2]
MNCSTNNQPFKIVIWIEHNDHCLVTTNKDGDKHLLEVQPEFAETTLEAIERYGKDILGLSFETIEYVDIIEQTTHQHVERTETVFLYRAEISEQEVLPKLTQSQIIFWLPIEKLRQNVSSNFLSKFTKVNK